MSFKRLQRALFRTMAAVVALAILFCIGLYGYRTMFGYTYDSSLSDEDLARASQRTKILRILHCSVWIPARATSRAIRTA